MQDIHARHQLELRRIADFVASRPGVPETFVAKYSLLADPDSGRKRMRLLQYELGLARCDVSGRVVLDAGCGTGLYSVIFALLGASRIEAFDLFPENVKFLTLVAKQFSLPIEARHGDISHTPLASGSVGLVYCTEAISHFRDWAGFLDEAARVLGPDGHLIIGDGNNGANPSIKGRIVDFWEESEVGPFVVNGRHRNTPYLFRRWMILRRALPQASDDQIYTLGLHTSHLGGDALIEACREYLRSGQLPGAPYRRGQHQIRPEDGQHNEEPLHPGQIVRHLRTRGLEARARAHFGFGRSPLLPIVNRAASWLGDVPLRFAGRYLVLARRRGGTTSAESPMHDARDTVTAAERVTAGESS